jgi:hypothetical protein
MEISQSLAPNLVAPDSKALHRICHVAFHFSVTRKRARKAGRVHTTQRSVVLASGGLNSERAEKERPWIALEKSGDELLGRALPTPYYEFVLSLLPSGPCASSVVDIRLADSETQTRQALQIKTFISASLAERVRARDAENAPNENRREFLDVRCSPSSAAKSPPRPRRTRQKDAVTQRGSVAPPPNSLGTCAARAKRCLTLLQRAATGVIPSPSCTSATLCRPTIRRPACPIRFLPRELSARRLLDDNEKK